VPLLRLDVDDRQIVMHSEGTICTTTQELVESAAFERVLDLYLRHLQRHSAGVLADLGLEPDDDEQRERLLELIRLLAHNPVTRILRARPKADGASLLDRRAALHDFVEGLYDFWRSFDRFLVNHSEVGPGGHDKRPYLTFNATVETLAALIRDLYRDVAENITGGHPRVYRQVTAGCEIGAIAVPKRWRLPNDYRHLLEGIPFVRHVLMYPPVILDPPTNTRRGRFTEVHDNPFVNMSLEKSDWMCYPAVVGQQVVFVYVHQRFIGLGLSLANLFEMASEKQIAAGPDAIYLYGAPVEALAGFADQPTIFYEDEGNRLLLGAVPLDDQYGYFGYLKKMILTLHNLTAMKHGLMPFHGAFTHIVLGDGSSANVLLIGDTATGKSETLEALRLAGDAELRELRIVADDMGTLEVLRGNVVGYGTEIGAFVRLDDLQQGYAFGQIDRAIIMSPQKVNARVVLPVTTLEEVLRGYPVDLLLYANNYQLVDDEHPIVEPFKTRDEALRVFGEGFAMSKGTTTATGLVSSYFANVFGPAQRPAVHDAIAQNVFAAAYAAGIYVGQLRTRLAVPGYESSGPREAAAALLQLIAQKRPGKERRLDDGND
jgi:hypothetical protein